MLRKLGVVTQPSCHGDRSDGAASPVSRSVALVGNPNIGKSTLFNALTGAHRRVGNWQGTSVEVGRGTWRVPASAAGPALELPVLDLPGAVSLDAVSPDEDLTRDLLYGGTCACDHGPQTCEETACACRASARPRLTVVLLDASDLTRGLYLLRQVRELALRVVVAMSMNDVAHRRGLSVDADALARHLGVPVVPVDPRRRTGLDALGDAVRASLAAPVPAPLPVPAVPTPVGGHPSSPDAAPDLRDGDDELARADARFTWILDVAADVVRHDGGRGETWPDRLDRLATGKVSGPVLFLAVMWVLFRLTTSVAAPLQGLLGDWVAGPFSDAVRSGLAAVSLGGGWIEGLLVDGLIAGVGTVLSFVPLMALIFLALAVLEDSGYLARAAVVTDRLMRAVGLPGRAFLPLTVGFGCNVPAVSATRALPDARHRLLTTLLVPFTTCSARLPVYVMVGSVFFGAHAGDAVFAMYVLSIVLVVLTGIALRKTLLRAVAPDPLVLDLPRYQRPSVRVLASSVWMRLADFLRTAGGVIVGAVVVVWLLGSVALPAAWMSGTAGTSARIGDGFAVSAQTPVERSLYRGLAELAEPGLAPAGFGDWHASGALLVGFVAKEAVVSSWAQTYSTEASQAATNGDASQSAAVHSALRRDFERTSHGSPVPAALAFCAFLLAYTPCAATLAAQKREVGWRWTLIGVGVQMLVAWVLAVLVFQVGRLLW
ncbi:MAG: ferrous iron transporter B [Kineosporiaceae bacterium]